MPFDVEILLRLLLAALLGGLIGAERERISRGAGLRTHAVVCTSSALIMVVSTYGFMQVLSTGKVVLDPSRVAAQVVSGVGFLGAGIIIFRKNAVRGLTTAASIWAVAAIGLAAGSGLYVPAIGGTAILSLLLTAMKKMEKKFFPQKQVNRLNIELTSNAIRTVSDKLNREGLRVLNMSVKQTNKENKSTLKVDAMAEEKIWVALFQELQAMPGVEAVSYTGRALLTADWGPEELDEESSGLENQSE
jgi:putative Mg2+ transporter-C (MgtC) family protein